jgi:hypothetical protein
MWGESSLSQEFFRSNETTNATFGIVEQDLGQEWGHFRGHIRRYPDQRTNIAAGDASELIVCELSRQTSPT